MESKDKKPLTAEEKANKIINSNYGKASFSQIHDIRECMLEYSDLVSYPLLTRIKELEEEKAHILKQFELFVEIIKTENHPNNLKNHTYDQEL